MGQIGLATLASATLALTTLMLVGRSVQAKEMCGTHDRVVTHLGDTYGEKPAVVALASNGGIIEVLVGDDGAWTLLVTRPSGVTCIVEFGEAWQDAPVELDGQPS